MLLAAPNQWIDLKSGEAFDPDPSILVSKAIATDYCAKSECPNFEAFVNDIFEGEQDLIVMFKGLSATVLRVNLRAMFVHHDW